YREVDRNRFQFDFLYFTLSPCDYDDEIRSLGGRIYRLAGAHPFLRLWALYTLLRKGDWSIVHSHTLFSSSLYLMAARLAGVPKRLAHSHSIQDSTRPGWLRRAYYRSARWLLKWTATHPLACSTPAAQYLFPGLRNVTIFPNAIDLERFVGASGSAVRDELEIPSDQLLILQVGRFMPVKNHTRSVRIADAMRNSGLNFQLLFAGTGPGMREIQKLVADRNLAQH